LWAKIFIRPSSVSYDNRLSDRRALGKFPLSQHWPSNNAIVVIRNPKRHVRKASYCGSKQQ